MKNRVVEILEFFKFPADVIKHVCDSYNGGNRYYHNLWHVLEMLNYADLNCSRLSDEDKAALYFAIIFHDVVYDTRSKTNEEDSFAVFEHAIGPFSIESPEEWEKWQRIEAKVKEMIIATKEHNYSESLPEYVKIMIKSDLERLTIPFPQFWENTKQIMKEYYWVDFSDFRKGRMEFFKSYGPKVAFMGDQAQKNIEAAYNTLSVWEPKIATYPGSFNPFTVGHLNIIEKAEMIFDKVIISRGVNPEKKGAIITDLPSPIKDRYQIDNYTGLLTDYLNTKDYPLTVIRGIRNSTDLSYELNQYRWLQEFNKNIQVVSLFCDKEYEHISSSAIKSIKSFIGVDKTKWEL